MSLRFQKLTLPSLDEPPPSAVAEALAGQRFVPPSLVEEERSAIVLPPTFTEDQIKQAEQEGYRKGFLEGEKEGRASVEAEQAQLTQALNEAVEHLNAELQSIIAAYNNFVQEQRMEVPKLALAIARKVAGHALDINPLPLLNAIATACIDRVLPAPSIVITVQEPLALPLEKHLTTHFAQNQDPGEITIQGDPSLAPGDCRITWDNGSAERNIAAIWQEIDNLIHEMAVSSGQRSAIAPHTDSTPPTDNPEGA